LHNEYPVWSHMHRAFQRSVCFKGGGGEIQETQAQRDSAQVAAERYNDFTTRYIPLENKYNSDVTGGDVVNGSWVDNGTTAIKQNVVAGRVNADLASQDNGAIPVGQINRIGSLVAGESVPKAAAAGASAMYNAKSQVRDAQVAGMQSAINVGSGQAASAIQGMGAIASNAADAAQADAESSFAKDSAVQGAIGSGIGAGAAAAGEYFKPSTKA